MDESIGAPMWQGGCDFMAEPGTKRARRNREAARASRERKRRYIADLEERVMAYQRAFKAIRALLESCEVVT